MYEKLHSSGHNLYWVTKDEWIFQINGQLHVGSLMQVVTAAVTRFGFSKTNILSAVEAMTKNLDKNHNAVHFGMYKDWIYTFYKEFSSEQVAS